MSGCSRQQDAGFTLMETLVALAVLAVGSMAVLTAVERHTASTRGLEDRIAARWVAENVLAAQTLRVAMLPDWSNALGVDWQVRIERRALINSGLEAVTVRVADAAAGPDASLMALTGYIPGQEGTQ